MSQQCNGIQEASDAMQRYGKLKAKEKKGRMLKITDLRSNESKHPQYYTTSNARTQKKESNSNEQVTRRREMTEQNIK
jgi:hypothetical protein